MTSSRLSRRTVLRGLGVSMALPWMESLPAWGNEPSARKPAGQAPTRMAILFAGCGFHRHEWWAKGTGADMKLGKVLQPLNDFRDRLVFIQGLYNAEALKGNIHSSQTGNLLSGAPLSSGGIIRSGTSLDQVVAQRIGHQTKLPSLVLGCEKANPSVHKNYSMLYSSHISWSSPTTPTPLEVYPALAFDQLFKDKAQKGDQSVLDAILADAKDVRRGISRLDQQKLDEYLNSVREVEKRIVRAGKRGELQGWRPTLSSPNIARPKDGYPQNIVDHMKLPKTTEKGSAVDVAACDAPSPAWLQTSESRIPSTCPGLVRLVPGSAMFQRAGSGVVVTLMRPMASHVVVCGRTRS